MLIKSQIYYPLNQFDISLLVFIWDKVKFKLYYIANSKNLNAEYPNYLDK